MSMMTQCRFKKVNVTEQIISWIPAKAAKLGTTMTLEGLSGRWEIIFVGTELNEQAVKERSMDYRNTRKASDI